MPTKQRKRDVPEYETGDLVITDAFLLDSWTAKCFSSNSSLVVVDKPADTYMQKLSEHIGANVYKEKAPGSEQQKDSESKGFLDASAPLLCTLQQYKNHKAPLGCRSRVLFMNLRKPEEKRQLLALARRSAACTVFLSNIYKLESTEEAAKIKYNRVLVVKNGFGLVRSQQALARTHRFIFAGAPHLKSSAFVLEMRQSIRVPCIVAVHDEASVEKVREALEPVEELAGRITKNPEEYRGKWILVVTYSQLPRLIRSEHFENTRNRTESLLSYDASDKKIDLLAMLQLCNNVVSLGTTQDRARMKRIMDSLPEYGAALSNQI